MNVNKLSIHKVFDSSDSFEAPLFQRPYVWNKSKNWEPLWEAIESLADRRKSNAEPRQHFLGTIVLDQLPTATGQHHARQIIDGQQRLTTLQLALAAARDLSNELGQTKFHEAFKQLCENRVPLSNDPNEVFKVWPTNPDQEDFRDVMTAGSSESIRRMPHADPKDEYLLPDAYLFFHESMRERLSGGDEESLPERIKALYHAMTQDLQVVVIDLQEKDDAQEIFETLNALGAPLLPVDLVKNHLFHKAQCEGLDLDKLHKRFWAVFDDEKSYWRSEVRQGRLKRARVDHFLNHYLALVLGDEIPITQLFSTYKQSIDADKAVSAVDHMSALREYADVYHRFDQFEKNSRAELFFYRLEALDTTTLFPLLLEIVRRAGSRIEVLDRVFADLESFVVRRAICQLTAKHYNKLFAELGRRLKSDDAAQPGVVGSWLLEEKAEATRWPTDEEFRRAWCSINFYKRMRQSRKRMILEALEERLLDGKTERVLIDRDLTIEHLMPREWEEHWPLPEGGQQEDLVERREALIHRIGNLTLLTRRLNPSLSNGPWKAKSAAILEHSALNLNRPLASLAEWGENAIARRTVGLFEVARHVWPHPQGKALSESPASIYRNILSSTDVMDIPVSEEVEEGRDLEADDDDEQPWKVDGQSWHLQRRCGPRSATLLKRIMALVNEVSPGITWDWNLKYCVTGYTGEDCWIWFQPRKTQLFLGIDTPELGFDWKGWAARLKLKALDWKDTDAIRRAISSSITAKKRQSHLAMQLRLKDDFDASCSEFKQFLQAWHATVEALSA